MPALSMESQAKLKDLIVATAKGEMAIEKQRQQLARQPSFEPYSMFQRLDRNGKGLIDSREILEFLRDNKEHSWTESQAFYLMKFYDSDLDDKLDYTDFLQMVLPCEDPELRATAT